MDTGYRQMQTSLKTFEKKQDGAIRLAFVPIVAFCFAIIVLFFCDIKSTHESPFFLTLLNLVFSTFAAFTVSYLAARGYLIEGTLSLLFIGCGMLTWGTVAGLVGFVCTDPNELLIVHNTGVFMAGISNLFGAAAILTNRRREPARPSGFLLMLAYLFSILVVLLILSAANNKIIPPFIIPGRGPTLLRQAVLGVGIAEFGLATILFRLAYVRSQIAFVRWYYWGLTLFTIGLIGAWLTTPGTPLNWTARAAQYAAGLYILVAIFTVRRATGGWRLTLEKAQREQKAASEFLRLLNAHHDLRPLIRAAVQFFRRESDCEAIGIRLHEGFDYPYYETHGFPEEFVLLENSLCECNADGDVLCDKVGNPVLGCMCGNVIRGRFDPSKPFFTPVGSFWTNSTSQLLATTTEKDRQARTRNRCNGEGYESVALIALRSGGECLGLLQLNDRRPHLFNLEKITYFERLAGYLGVALANQRSEDALRESRKQNAFLGTVLENSSQPFASGYPDGRIGLCNRAFEKLTGYTIDELKSIDWTKQLTPPEWRAIEREKLDELHRLKKPVRYEKEYIRKDGSRVPIELLVHLVHGADGKPEYYYSFLTDITERKQTEAVLHRSMQRLSLLSEVASKLLSSQNPQLLVNALCRKIMLHLDCHVFFNFLLEPRYGRLHLNACGGIESDIASKIEWLDLGSAICGCVARDGKRIVAENVLNSTDPKTDLIRSFGIQAYACHPLFNQYEVIGTLSFGSRTRTSFDADELELMKTVADQVAIAMQRVRLLESIEQRAAEAQAANEAKSRFLANVSHELRTPMNAILGMVELALKKPLDSATRDFLETTHESADLLLALLNDLLDCAKIESGKLELEILPFSLRRILDQLTRVLAVRASEKGIAFSASIQGEVPDAFLGDQVRLRQILFNLAGNAIKFTERGEVALLVQVESKEDKHAVLEFSVRDTGLGIAPEDLKRIFLPFTQADLSISRRFGGTGLGLSIASNLVRLMEGQMAAESTPNVGSTFHFTIRLPLANEAPLSADAGFQISSVPARQLRVLLVEDNPANQKLATYILQERGHTVDVAGNGLEAIQAFDQKPYDVILMDVQMPGMSGIEATAAIRRRENAGGQVPIVAMTAHAMKGDRERSLAEGMDGYLAKPIDGNELIFLVERLAAERTATNAETDSQPLDAFDAEKRRSAVEKNVSSLDQTAAASEETATPAVFSRDAALKKCAHNPKMLDEMIRYYFDEVHLLFPQMYAALQNGNVVEVGRLAHRLKGTILYLDTGSAEEAAVRLESLGRENIDGVEAEEAVRVLQRECEVLKNALVMHRREVSPVKE